MKTISFVLTIISCILTARGENIEVDGLIGKIIDGKNGTIRAALTGYDESRDWEKLEIKESHEIEGYDRFTNLIFIEIADNAFENAFSKYPMPIPAYLPSSIQSIGKKAFYGANISEINFPEGLTIIHDSAFCNSSITKAILPESLQFIGKYAFQGSNINKFQIPSNLKSFSRWALGNCQNLTSIISLAEIPAKVELNTFGVYDDEYNLPPMIEMSIDFEKCKLYVPDSSMTEYSQAEGWNLFERHGNLLPLSEYSSETTYLEQIEESHFTVLNGITPAEKCNLYDSEGRLITSDVTYGSLGNIPLQKGIYIVSSAKGSLKLNIN